MQIRQSDQVDPKNARRCVPKVGEKFRVVLGEQSLIGRVVPETVFPAGVMVPPRIPEAAQVRRDVGGAPRLMDDLGNHESATLLDHLGSGVQCTFRQNNCMTEARGMRASSQLGISAVSDTTRAAGEAESLVVKRCRPVRENRVVHGGRRQTCRSCLGSRPAAHGFVGITDAWPLTHRQAPSFSTQIFVNRDARSKGLPSLSLPVSL